MAELGVDFTVEELLGAHQAMDRLENESTPNDPARAGVIYRLQRYGEAARETLDRRHKNERGRMVSNAVDATLFAGLSAGLGFLTLDAAIIPEPTGITKAVAVMFGAETVGSYWFFVRAANNMLQASENANQAKRFLRRQEVINIRLDEDKRNAALVKLEERRKKLEGARGLKKLFVRNRLREVRRDQDILNVHEGLGAFEVQSGYVNL